MTASESRREDILIEPYKQLRFGAMFLVLNLVFSTLLFLTFAYYLWDIYRTIAVYFHLNDQQSLVTLTKFAYPATVGLILVFLFILATLIMSARYTHQIYGPLVSIRRFLAELAEGQRPQPIKLRASDQLKDLVEQLNNLRENFTLSQKDLDKLSAYVEQIANKQNPPPLDLGKNQLLEKLLDNLNKINNQIK